MPRTALTAQSLASSGVTPTYASADNTQGENFSNNGRRVLHVKNTGGGSCTVTIAIPATVDGIAATNRTVTVAATTGDRLIGPFPTLYNQTDGSINVDYSTGTGVTRALFDMPLVS